MKIKKLKLLEETDTHYIFEITYNSFWKKDQTRTATSKKGVLLHRWADTGELIMNDHIIDAWVSTNKETFIV